MAFFYFLKKKPKQIKDNIYKLEYCSHNCCLDTRFYVISILETNIIYLT